MSCNNRFNISSASEHYIFESMDNAVDNAFWIMLLNPRGLYVKFLGCIRAYMFG